MALVSVFAVSHGTLARAEIITSCGQTVANGVLAHDLDCMGYPGAAVTVAANGTLDLAGFTVTGGMGDGIYCEQTCSVTGQNGTVTGAAENGIGGRGIITLSHVTLTDNGGSGARSTPDKDDTRGFYKHCQIIASSVSATNNGGNGIFAVLVEASSSTFSGNQFDGITALWGATLSGSTISFNNGSGLMINAARAKTRVENCTIEGNAANGVSSPRRPLIVSGSVVVNNGHRGISLSKSRIFIDSTIATGNGALPACSSEDCADVLARRVMAVSVTCDRSFRYSRDGFFAGTFGICLDD